jgi:hypothetical protein
MDFRCQLRHRRLTAQICRGRFMIWRCRFFAFSEHRFRATKECLLALSKCYLAKCAKSRLFQVWKRLSLLSSISWSRFGTTWRLPSTSARTRRKTICKQDQEWRARTKCVAVYPLLSFQDQLLTEFQTRLFSAGQEFRLARRLSSSISVCLCTDHVSTVPGFTQLAPCKLKNCRIQIVSRWWTLCWVQYFTQLSLMKSQSHASKCISVACDRW